MWNAFATGYSGANLSPVTLLVLRAIWHLKLGVSRVPVRDAFKTLQALGIVEVKKGSKGGARIARGDPNHFADALAVQLKLVGVTVEEMFDAQIAIEVMATELAAKHATEADLQKLRTLLGELQDLCLKPMSKADCFALHQCGDAVSRGTCRSIA